MSTSFQIPRPDAGSFTGGPLPTSQGVGLAGPGTIGDQYATLIAHWNEARFLSKPAAVRHMMMLRQRGQGGTFDTEAQALKARIDAAENLDPNIYAGTYDLLIDVYHAGFNAYETLVLRSQNPFGTETTPLPDLAHLPLPAPDLNESSTPQPFSEWMSVGAPADGGNGVGSQWTPSPDDKSEIGSTWSGLAKRTNTKGTYTKMRFLPWGVILDRWVRTA